MKLLSYIKGLLKKREVSKLKPDINFEFDDYTYFDENNIEEKFEIIYSNNYTDNYCKDMQLELSYISSVITLSKTEKTLEDLVTFINTYHNIDLDGVKKFTYNSIHIEIIDELIKIHLRGNLLFYSAICEVIHNNIITKLIRNTIIPNGRLITTPDRFMNNMYNSINYPNKDIDILFIEENNPKQLNPVIGLSVSKSCTEIDSYYKLINVGKQYYTINNRNIVYTEVNNLSEKDLDYIINNVKHGNKLLDIIHKDNIEDDINLDIDEIIED